MKTIEVCRHARHANYAETFTFYCWCIWHRQLAASATRINAFFLKSNWFHDSHLHWDPYHDNSSQCFAFFSGATEAYIIEPYTCLCPHFISWTVSISADILLVELWRPLPTLSVEMCHNYICPHFVSWTVLISAHVSSESADKGVSYMVPERRHTNTTTKTWIAYCNYYWHASKYKVRKLHQRYILKRFYQLSCVDLCPHFIG